MDVDVHHWRETGTIFDDSTTESDVAYSCNIRCRLDSTQHSEPATYWMFMYAEAMFEQVAQLSQRPRI